MKKYNYHLYIIKMTKYTISKNILNNHFVKYLFFLFSAFFIGGVITKIYGNTCGIDIWSISTWGRTFFLMPSPWCKTLNWICYICNSVVENIWIHFITITVGVFIKYIPEIQNKVLNPVRERVWVRS